MRDYRDFPKLTAELVALGYSTNEIDRATFNHFDAMQLVPRPSAERVAAWIEAERAEHEAEMRAEQYGRGSY